VGRGFLFIFLFLLLIHGSSHNKNKNKLLRKQKIAENATRENRNKNLALQKIVGWVQKKNTKQKQNHTEQTKENQPQKRHSNMTKIKTKTHKLACIWLHMNEPDVMGNVEKFWFWQISERFRYSRSLRLPSELVEQPSQLQLPCIVCILRVFFYILPTCSCVGNHAFMTILSLQASSAMQRRDVRGNPS